MTTDASDRGAAPDGGADDPGIDPSDPAVYDHFRASDRAAVEPGVYRVVGTEPSTVTLLRVGDAGGRRVNTGTVVSVAREELAGFEAAANPDGNRRATEAATGFLSDLGWQLRAFLAGLRARPVASVAALALVVVGHQGDRLLSVPDAWLTAVYVAGVLAVIYLGARGG